MKFLAELHVFYCCCCFREQVLFPLQFVGKLGEMDVEVSVEGGGLSGQAGAIRYALAKALSSFVDATTMERMRLGNEYSKH